MLSEEIRSSFVVIHKKVYEKVQDILESVWPGKPKATWGYVVVVFQYSAG